jgi:putative transposase
MAVLRTYHNVYDAHYHIVFPVKYRKALLKDDIPLAINKLAQEIGERYDIEFEKLGYDQDHIHMLVSFPPKHSGSDVVRIFRQGSEQLILTLPNTFGASSPPLHPAQSECG